MLKSYQLPVEHIKKYWKGKINANNIIFTIFEVLLVKDLWHYKKCAEVSARRACVSP